ncbi:hypothetical protein PILCRDRAFT_17462 [Piloderma croceum F 1598]|uniref:Uncharacterized protein n=1 Tax=Piloderma croceum (strain F 1598) TaxID=765440 RepID=A0A0C3EED2_PILCF|nr:hypothetical protein PILCRDRAFT_17462 [Piloderma croceum F 1598]
MKIEIAIENGRSLKLRQTRQVDASLSSTTRTQPTTNDGHTIYRLTAPRNRATALGFVFFGPPAPRSALRAPRSALRAPRSALRVSRTHHPTTTTTSDAPRCHPYAPSPVAVSHGAPATEPRQLGCGFFWLNSSLAPVSRAHGPTTTTISYEPPHHHYAPSPVAVSHGAPQIEPQRLGFGCWPKTPCLAPVSRAHSPTAAATSYTPPHHPSAPFPFANSYGAPEIEPRRLGFGFLPQTPPPASRLQTQRPTTTTPSSAPSHHLPSLLSTPISDGAFEIEP